jgi:membrane associated rhomboid family serine protease
MATLYGLFGVVLVVVGVGAPVDWFAPVFGLLCALLCAYIFFLLFRWFTKYLDRRESRKRMYCLLC